MRFPPRAAPLLALVAALVAALVVAIAQASPQPPTAQMAGAREVKVLKSIDKQLKRLNRNLGPTSSAGLRGQLEELRGDVRTLNQVRELLQRLQGMPSSLERIANNTAFEEVP